MSTKHLLDSETIYKKYDTEDVAFGIEQLARQMQIGFSLAKEVSFSKTNKGCSQIVVLGMGGSSLGGHVLQSALNDRLKVPVVLVRDYVLPKWVNTKTLVILSSFSGSTQEVLFAAGQAKAVGAKRIVMTSGGKLSRLAKQEGLPLALFDPKDLAKQPRFGLGFSLSILLSIVSQLGYVKVTAKEQKMCVDAMADVVDHCAIDIPFKQNPAKQVAQSLYKKNIFLLCAEHLQGAAHVVQNQVHESAKQYAHNLVLPEMNHHFLESMGKSGALLRASTTLCFSSKLYQKKNQKRMQITADLLEEAGSEIVEYQAQGASPLEEAVEIIQFGSFATYYLAMLNRVDPMDIPFVKTFKKRMSGK